ncbi:MAG TPA: hypothetical protein VGR70_00695 [Stellaceae bacterium]|nr:hypothetical protein [Stellaceae bacterium]
MRVAKMPYVYPEKGGYTGKKGQTIPAKNRFEYRRRYPQDVVAHLGKTFFIHKYPQGVSQAMANELSHEQSAAFKETVAKARRALAPPRAPWDIWEPAPGRPDGRWSYGHQADAPVPQNGIAYDRFTGEVVATGKTAAGDPAPYEGIVNLWADMAAKTQRARNSRMGQIRAMMQFLGHSDMNRVRPDDLQGYKEHLVAKMTAGVWRPKTVDDHIEMIKAQFRWAKENRKIGQNPALELRGIGGSTDPRNARQDFNNADIALILTRARTAPPLIRWSNLLAAYTGARLSEIVEADTRDIDGQTFHIRLRHRPETMRLKTIERPVPLHSAILAEGFGDYVRGRPPGPLFDVALDRNGQMGTNANRIIMPWLRDIGITDPRKTFHSWRHTFKTLARDWGMEEQFSDAITGHVNGKIGREYGSFPMGILREQVERIPNPPRYREG